MVLARAGSELGTNELTMIMAPPQSSLVPILIQIVIACTLTLALLELARFLGGSTALWSVGIALLLLAALGLLRTRK
jgi:uncharacterized membrane protein